MENKAVKTSSRGIRNMWTGAFMGAVVTGVLLVEASKSCSLDQSQLMLIWFKNVAVGTLVGAAFGVVVDRFVKNLARKSQSLVQHPRISSQDSVQA
jgi:glucose-6-phosphate-specific signal transduction histidine kinase